MELGESPTDVVPVAIEGAIETPLRRCTSQRYQHNPFAKMIGDIKLNKATLRPIMKMGRTSDPRIWAGGDYQIGAANLAGFRNGRGGAAAASITKHLG